MGIHVKPLPSPSFGLGTALTQQQSARGVTLRAVSVHILAIIQLLLSGGRTQTIATVNTMLYNSDTNPDANSHSDNHEYW